MENSPSSPYALGRYLEDTQRVPLLTSDDETRLSQLIFAGREAASIPEEQQDETVRPPQQESKPNPSSSKRTSARHLDRTQLPRFRCVQCRHKAHADVNAAQNILGRADPTLTTA